MVGLEVDGDGLLEDDTERPGKEQSNLESLLQYNAVQ